MKYLIPLVALAALVVGLLWFFNRAPAVVAPKITVVTPKIPEVKIPAISTEAVQLGKDVTGWFASLTKSLGGITDAATADAALPILKEAAGKLDVVKTALDKLPAAGKASILSIIKSNLEGFKKVIATVTSIPGVGDKLKPVIDPIMSTLNALGG